MHFTLTDNLVIVTDAEISALSEAKLMVKTGSTAPNPEEKI